MMLKNAQNVGFTYKKMKVVTIWLVLIMIVNFNFVGYAWKNILIIIILISEVLAMDYNLEIEIIGYIEVIFGDIFVDFL